MMRFALLILALLAVTIPFAGTPSRKVLTLHDERLPVHFPHEKHGEQTCLSCHHKVAGMNETIPCVTCHRLPDPALKLSVEPRFHALCRDCHERRDRAGLPHGPVRDCGGCHGVFHAT